jgi:integrase
MMRRDRGGRYAFFYAGRWRVNPPVTHPPLCACEVCPRRRRDNEWDREFIVRIDRVSPYESEARSIAYAHELKEREESRLRIAADAARSQLRALVNKKSLGDVMEAYRHYQRETGKRLDREESRVNRIEEYFHEWRDPQSISKAELKAFQAWLASEQAAAPATVQRHVTVLLAALNHAVREELISSHQLIGVRRVTVRRTTRPKIFTTRQMEVLLGAAMDRFEAWQHETERLAGGTGLVPLRGFVLVAFRTAMRPANNFALTWEQLRIDPDRGEGSFRLDRHKNSSRGVEVEGPLAPSLLRYLVGIMPAGKASGLVHPNPRTGAPFKNIRHSWRRLIAFANELLPPEEQIGSELDFYNLRHSAVSQLVAAGADPVAVVRLMGDTSLSTVLRHYFDSELTHLQRLIRQWDSAGAGAGGGR